MRTSSVIALCAIAMLPIPFKASSARAETPTIRVGISPGGMFLPLFYLEKIAEKHGLKVQPIELRSGPAAAQALKAGELEMASGGVEAAVSAVGGGAPAVIVSGIADGALTWLGRSDLKWNSPLDLKGRKIVLARGLHELVLLVAAEKLGFVASQDAGPDNVQMIFANSAATVFNSLKSKDADAISSVEPITARLIRDGTAVPLLEPTNTVLGPLPRVAVMRRDFMEKNPETAQRAVDALVEATKILRDNPAMAADFAVNGPLKGQMSIEDWTDGLKRMRFDVAIDVALVQNYVDAMIKHKMLREQLRAESFTDVTLLERAKKSAGW